LPGGLSCAKMTIRTTVRGGAFTVPARKGFIEEGEAGAAL
jgi:hypothetical protein